MKLTGVYPHRDELLRAIHMLQEKSLRDLDILSSASNKTSSVEFIFLSLSSVILQVRKPECQYLFLYIGHLQKQVKEKILEVFSWINGSYRFFAGQSYQGEVVPLQIGNYALIAEGVRKYTSIELLKNKFRPRLDKATKRLPNHYLKSDQLGLSAREQRVADSVDSKKTVRDLLTMGGSDRHEFEEAVYQVMYILEELEMLKFV